MKEVIEKVKKNTTHLREMVWFGMSSLSMQGVKTVHLKAVMGVIVLAQTDAVNAYHEHIKTFLKEKGEYELCEKLDKELEAIKYELKEFKG